MKKNSIGLTTTKAPFIENAREEGKLFIHQPYELYSEENQEAWRKLYALLLPRWQKYANQKFMEGVEALCLNPLRIARLEEINAFLEPLTGFKTKAVSGYVPSYLFFSCLKQREFPTTITIRDGQSLYYLPEPDIFHDIAGHVPMHTDRTFAEVLVRFGWLSQSAAKRLDLIADRAEKRSRAASILQALSRFFWFTIEFGLMRQNNELKVYGSGLLSSASEIERSVISSDVQRYPFQLEWAINQSFEIDHCQPVLFVIDSFEHLYEEVEKLHQWLLMGKLDHAAPGEPRIEESDIDIFLGSLS